MTLERKGGVRGLLGALCVLSDDSSKVDKILLGGGEGWFDNGEHAKKHMSNRPIFSFREGGTS